MVWSFSTNETASLPLLWTEGPFVGNGMVGALFTVEPSADAGLAIKVEVARAVWGGLMLSPSRPRPAPRTLPHLGGSSHHHRHTHPLRPSPSTTATTTNTINTTTNTTANTNNTTTTTVTNTTTLTHTTHPPPPPAHRRSQDYWDIRLPGTKYNTNMMYHDTPRLPGGYFTLVPPAGAKIVGGTARVSLYTAALTMPLRVAMATETRDVTLGAVVPADRPGMLLIEGTVLASFNLS